MTMPEGGPVQVMAFGSTSGIHIWEERTVHGVDKDLDVGGGHLVWVGF